MLVACAAALSPTAASAIGPMTTARDFPVAVTLQNGKVLIAGGTDSGGSSLQTAELFDPATGTFSAAGLGAMTTPRDGAVAAPLPNGKVLIAGGDDNGTVLQSAELFDPASGTFSSAGLGTMTTPRDDAMAAPLPNGEVLIAGGIDTGSPLQSAELFNPSTGTFSAAGVGSMATARYSAIAAPLPGGKVLIAGGISSPLGADQDAELFNQATDSFSTGLGAMTVPRAGAMAAALPGGDVAIAGGTTNASAVFSNAELFDPVSGTFTAAGVPPLSTARENGAMATLANGQVLVAGGDTGCGCGSGQVLSSAELLTVPAPLAAATSGDFGSHTVSQASAVQTVTITNAGAQALAISGDSITGANAGDFAIAADACTSRRLAYLQTCTVGVRFTPQATGSRSATLQLQDNEVSPAAIPLVGTGTPAVSGPPGPPGPPGPRGPAGGELSLRQVRPRADGTITLSVVVPGPGTVDVLETAWKSNLARVAILHPAPGRFVFARDHLVAGRATTLRFTVRPNAQGKRLVRHHRYPVTLRIWATYTARNGAKPQNMSIYGLQLP